MYKYNAIYRMSAQHPLAKQITQQLQAAKLDNLSNLPYWLTKTVLEQKQPS